jgi:lysophospholipase L1-like esterase/tetratricopeptide (TPR) repeat protein
MRHWTRLKRWFVFASFVLVATAALIELLLQAGAYAVYLANRKDIASAPAQSQTVLCVGDSWTHGMGTSDAAQHSYPSVLERVLRERTKQDWSVVNGGQSGQNSRDVLLRLQSQLDTVKPKVVCVLVGRNDQWSAPDEVPQGDSEASFSTYRFRWRLPRLFAWTFDSLFPKTQFQPVSKTGMEWKAKQVPWPAAPKGATYPVAVSKSGSEAKTLGWNLEAQGSSEAALEQFRRSYAESPEDPQTRGMLAILTLKCGQMEESQMHASWLMDQWKAQQNYFHGRALLDYYSFTGCAQDQLEQARRMIEMHPSEPSLWLQQGEAEFRLGNKMDSKRSLLKCIESWDFVYAYSLLFKIALYYENSQTAALDTIIQAYVATNDHVAMASMLNTMLESPQVDGQALTESAKRFACDPDTKSRILAVIDEALHRRDGNAAETVLARHLKRIADLTRSKGAVPVFLDYPIQAPLQHCLRDVASDDAIPFLDIKTWWEQRVPEPQRMPLRSADGHVNDEGYRIMAECVADGLIPILQTLK